LTEIVKSLSPVLEASRPVCLTVEHSGTNETQTHQLARPNISIGRRTVNNLVLNDLTVSGQHAEIIQFPEHFELRDLGSRNGTLLDGQPVTTTPLKDGAKLQIGVYRLEFRLVVETPEEKLVEQSVGVLEYLTGGMRGIKQQLTKPITRVGVSGQVVVLSKRKTGYFVTHLEGLSRALLNGQPVSNRAVALSHDDIIEMNTTRIRFRLL